MTVRKSHRAAAAVLLAGGALLVGAAPPASAAEQSPYGVITLDPNTAIEDGQTVTLHAQRLAPDTLYDTVQCNTQTLHCVPINTTFTTDSDGNATLQLVPERVIEGVLNEGTPDEETFREDCGAAARRCSVIAFNDKDGTFDSYAASLTFVQAPK